MKVSDILKALPLLSSDELSQVGLAVKACAAMSVTVKGKPVEIVSDDWLLNGIGIWLSGEGVIIDRLPLVALRRRDAYKLYAIKLPEVLSFLRQLELQMSTTTRHRYKLSLICAGALASMLRERNYFSVSAMLSQIDKIPEALDMAYPGYVQAGLFRFVMGGADVVV